MPSMTGFGHGRAADARGELRVQIASVNNRSWQISVRGDLGDLVLEDEVKQTARAALVRGTVNVQVQVLPVAGTLGDPAALAASWRSLATLAAELGAPVPRLEDIVRLVSTTPATRTAASSWADLLRPALTQALTGVQAARATEGAALVEACVSDARSLRVLCGRMRESAAARMPRLRDSLRERLAEILREQVDPSILARELALHAERIDVSEEQVRLAAHLDALDALLAGANDPKAETGRRLEFLMQEIGREVNTTGAKANDAALAALVMEAKLLIDRLKEQAANLS